MLNWFRDLIAKYKAKREQRALQAEYDTIKRSFMNEMQTVLKEFSPYTGYSFYSAVLTMLKFYKSLYEPGNAEKFCWTCREHTDKVYASITQAYGLLAKVDQFAELSPEALIAEAEKEQSWQKYLEAAQERCCKKLLDNQHVLSAEAETFLSDLYTEKAFECIGKYLWEWYD